MTYLLDTNACVMYLNGRERIGTPIGGNDLMIAAIAMTAGLTVVTHNCREFGRVAGLQVEDWEAGP